MADSDAKGPGNFLLAGALVLALGVGYFVFLDGGGDDDLGCQVTAAGVAIIASGLTHGRSTTQIVTNAVAGIGTLGACTRVVDSLRAEPATPVAIEVVTPEGAGQVSVTGSELTRVTGSTTCDDWLTADNENACYNGEIGPPFADLDAAFQTCEDWLLPSLAESCRRGEIGPPTQ